MDTAILSAAGKAVCQFNDENPVVNAMTVDVEDYFQVSAFERHVPPARWDACESRVCQNTERLLDIFDRADVTATFFVLGWVAERFPGLVRRIAACGHEIASHGYGHRLVYELRRDEFSEDLRRARGALEEACSTHVRGYRAPSYSITRQSLWALDVLVEQGYTYDASIFPIHHDRYGIPHSPRHPYLVDRPLGTIWEFPGATVRWGRQNLPIGGGGYFRLLPYEWTRRGIAHVNNTERKAVMFYLHPWEIDPDQPRIHAPLRSRLRHYTNLARTEERLIRLLSEFKFGSAISVLSDATVADTVGEPLTAIAVV